MSMKQAAEELLKIADEIEREANGVTDFVCANCNHTATLSTINQKRHEAADSLENVVVADITVNEKTECPACDGIMAYSETDDSKAYYFEPKAADEDADSADEDDEKKKKASEPIDYDSLERYSNA